MVYADQQVRFLVARRPEHRQAGRAPAYDVPERKRRLGGLDAPQDAGVHAVHLVQDHQVALDVQLGLEDVRRMNVAAHREPGLGRLGLDTLGADQTASGVEHAAGDAAVDEHAAAGLKKRPFRDDAPNQQKPIGLDALIGLDRRTVKFPQRHDLECPVLNQNHPVRLSRYVALSVAADAPDGQGSVG